MNEPGNNCPHYHHWRLCAPFRFCILCGDVVNKCIPVGKCDQEHALPHSPEDKYCVNCGEPLAQPVLVAMVSGKPDQKAEPAKTSVPLP